MIFSLLALVATAAEPVSLDAYAKQYPVQLPTADQVETLDRCLKAWNQSPFTDLANTHIRIIEAKVRVMGLGGTEPKDELSTTAPQLVLLEPSVNVMTGTTYKLLNPNGWYCMDQATTALSKLSIQLQCDAHFANSHGGVAVLAGDNSEHAQGGVVVLGGVEVTRVGCK